MIARWLPWKWLVGRLAKSHGFIDPFAVLARLRKFAEPSEVEAPLELIRAWTVLQARGVVNTRAIQHNLDWVWPYWVERQFNPRDTSFVPRSFSATHINLTNRNWTAVCVPDADRYALVDPRGLVTPLHDGWSLDAWIVTEGDDLIPSRCHDVRQIMRNEGELAIETQARQNGLNLFSRAEMKRDTAHGLHLDLLYEAESDRPATLCIALRPYNPEGVQFIDTVQQIGETPGWLVNGKTQVLLNPGPANYALSIYRTGDVFHRLKDKVPEGLTECPVGMVTAAAQFPIHAGGRSHVSVSIPMDESPGVFAPAKGTFRSRTSWEALDRVSARLEVPDERISYLYRAATRTLLSLSAGDVYPGSYTYRRFWFRDACIMLNALLTLNHEEAFLRAFETSFLRRQTLTGFFESQEGEWDSNGQVLWLTGRYAALSGKPLPPYVLKAIRKGADWLCRKRRPRGSDQMHAGLLPSGFSAEHLGPNNFYYWDNFWGLAGLRAAADLFRQAGDTDYADTLQAKADEYELDIRASIEAIPTSPCANAIPAAPDRRMDAGAIGSLAADYPLQIVEAGDERMMKTVEFLLANCMIDDGFFHDMIHSGINPYLTLHLAQILLRADDQRYIPLIRRVAELASPTGQWPEAIHPLTGGGCMGDGQHGWAAAEWVMMIRNLFVREEADHLVIASGLFPEWLNSGKTLRFGPTATAFGRITVSVDTSGPKPKVDIEGQWHTEPPRLVIALDTAQPQTTSGSGSDKP